MDKIKLLDELNKLKELIDLIVEIDTFPDYVVDTETDITSVSYESDADHSRSYHNVYSLISFFCGRVEYVGDELDDLIKIIRDDVEIVERQPIKPAPGQLPLLGFNNEP